MTSIQESRHEGLIRESGVSIYMFQFSKNNKGCVKKIWGKKWAIGTRKVGTYPDWTFRDQKKDERLKKTPSYLYKKMEETSGGS